MVSRRLKVKKRDGDVTLLGFLARRSSTRLILDEDRPGMSPGLHVAIKRLPSHCRAVSTVH